MVLNIEEGGRVRSCMVVRVWFQLQRLFSPKFSFSSSAHLLPHPDSLKPRPLRPVAPLGQVGTLPASELAQATRAR